jgi:hypothetical protein
VAGRLPGLRLASLVFLAAAIAAGCARSPERGHNAPTFGDVPRLLDVQVTTAREVYLEGEDVSIQLSVTNLGDGELALGPFPPAVELVPVGRDDSARELPGGGDEAVLAPGERRSATVTWNQLDEAGKPVPPGRHAVRFNLRMNEGGMTWRSNPEPDGGETVVVGYRQGSLVAAVPVGQATERGGVRVELDQLEAQEESAIVRGRVVPPGYDFPEGRSSGPVMPPMSILPFNPVAEYAVDGAAPKRAHGSFRPRERDVEVQWDLDALASDGRTLTFTVTSLGRWGGPWTFTIDLARR